MIRMLLSMVFYYFSGFCSGQSISFFREDINFTLEAGNFEVNGLYYFRNNSEKKIRQLLFYPFPDIQQYGKIGSIEIVRLGDTLSEIATLSEKGSMYKLVIEPYEETIYHIVYNQILPSSQASYILTTTQQWRTPFEQANYTLKKPAYLVIDSLSIQPDSMLNNNDSTYYFWNRRNYMPEDDFNIWFSEKY